MSYLNEEEFLEQARKHGLGSLIDELQAKSRKTQGAIKFNKVVSAIVVFLLSPIICVGDLTFLFSGKGVGKTTLALSLAFAVALGRSLFGHLKASLPRNTLYVDGEIGDNGLDKRISDQRRIFGLSKDQDIPIWFLSERINLYKTEGRKRIDGMMVQIQAEDPSGKGIEFIVLDNLTSMQGGVDAPAGWDAFYDWAMNLKGNGITILILFHANDDKKMRGSQMKEINADNVIYLEQPEEKCDNSKKKKSLSASLPQDRSKIRFDIVFKNLRNNKFPEAYTPIQAEYSIPACSWSMVNEDDYYKGCLTSLSKHLSDEEMAQFFGESPRQIRELRRKYSISKYGNNNE